MQAGLERTYLAWAWTSQLVAICVVGCSVLLLRSLDLPLGRLAFAVPATMALVIVINRLRPHAATPFIVGSVVFGLWFWFAGEPASGALLAVGSVAGAYGALSLAARLPAVLDGNLNRRRALTSFVALAVLIGLAQGTRLTAFMANYKLTWGSAMPFVEDGIDHECLAAYLYAGELNARGVADVYEPTLYPDSESSTPIEIESAVTGMDRVIDDPYLYPPVFLLLPRLALALSDDYGALRFGVFAVNSVAFLIVSLLFCAWIGSKHGIVPGLLLPLLWGSIPTLFNFQFGQFQLMAVVLSVAAMLAFEYKRHALGGSLLAFAVLGKIFPGILVFWLLVRRDWKAIRWTATWGLALTLISLVVVGPETYRHFLSEQVPRLASGDVAPFFKESNFQIATNISVYGLAFKLQALGVLDDAELIAKLLNTAFTLGLLFFAIQTARRAGMSREDRAIVWIALIVLATMRSPYLPSVYGYVGAIWLLSLMARRATGSKWRIGAVILAWFALSPAPPNDDIVIAIIPSFVGPLVFLALGFIALTRAKPSISSDECGTDHR